LRLGPQHTAASLVSMRNMPVLEEVNLVSTKIPPQEISQIKLSPTVKRATLFQVPCDDLVMASLVQLSNLELLTLQSCGVTSEQETALKAALPNCRITVR
jgi:hypothetical protein